MMLDTEQGVLLICGHCWPTDQDSPGVADGRHQGPIYAYGCDCSPAHLCPPWGRQFVCPGLSSSMRARFPRVAEMESKEVPPTVRLADRFICSEQSAEAFLKQLRFTRERPAHAKSPLPLVPSKRALEAAAPASSGGFEHTMRHLAMDGTPRPPAVTSRSPPGAGWAAPTAPLGAQGPPHRAPVTAASPPREAAGVPAGALAFAPQFHRAQRSARVEAAISAKTHAPAHAVDRRGVAWQLPSADALVPTDAASALDPTMLLTDMAVLERIAASVAMGPSGKMRKRMTPAEKAALVSTDQVEAYKRDGAVAFMARVLPPIAVNALLGGHAGARQIPGVEDRAAALVEVLM